MYDPGLETETAKPRQGAANVGQMRDKSDVARHILTIGVATLMVQLVLALALGPLVGLPLWLAHALAFAAGMVFALREYMTREVPRSSNTCDQLEATGRFLFIAPTGLVLGLIALIALPGTLHAAAIQSLIMLVSAGFTYIAIRLWVT